MRLYLVRHGQTAWNAAGKLQGHANVALNDEGRRQASLVAEAFREIPLRAIWTSDLARSLETALELHRTTGARLVLNHLLRERAFGEWEGQSWAEVQRGALPDGPLANGRVLPADPPGGESVAEFSARLAPLTTALGQATGPVALVSHGGTLRLLLTQLMGAEPIAGRFFEFPNASITELERDGRGIWRLRRYADERHLAPRPETRELEPSA